jgi:hypothetical protein
MPDDHRPLRADDAPQPKNDTGSADRPTAEHVREDIPVEVVAGGVWASRPVAAQPVLRLARWQIYAVRDALIFVGFNLDDCEGRVSSAIQSLDVAARRGVTLSGRNYELVGPEGYDGDGEWVFAVWLKMCRVRRSEVRPVPLEEAARMLAG